MPKKALRLATRMALLSKFQDGEAVVLDGFKVTEPRTKPVAEMLKKLGLADKSILLVIGQHDDNVWCSGRNIGNLLISPAADLNAYQLLRQKMLVITREAIDQLRKGPPVSAAAAS
jgi:large subunit ribosomal protein L4